MKYKIHVYVVCWNEMDNIPFVVDYWKRFAERVIVYDNGSDDGSVEYLSQYPWIEVRQFKTNGFDDTANMNIKNSCWKESIGIADFVVVSDLDECLYSPVLESEFDYMKANDITICGPRQYALQGDYYPGYQSDKLLHEIITRVRFQKSNHSTWCDTSGKLMLFDPNKIKETNYGPGCHMANPTGTVKLYDRDKIFCIHINRGFGADYNIKRSRILQERNSPENKRKGYAVHYSFSDERIRSDYQKGTERSINILDILNETFSNE